MGVAQFNFPFQGTVKDFNNQLDNWLKTTPEGKRYRYKNPGSGFAIKLQRGIGLLTAPIFLEFGFGQENGTSIDIFAIGYVRNFAILGKSPISEKAAFGALPRRNGWKDMMKIFSFLDIQNFNSTTV